jgi:hypothetical protein
VQEFQYILCSSFFGDAVSQRELFYNRRFRKSLLYAIDNQRPYPIEPEDPIVLDVKNDFSVLVACASNVGRKCDHCLESPTSWSGAECATECRLEATSF